MESYMLFSSFLTKLIYSSTLIEKFEYLKCLKIPLNLIISLNGFCVKILSIISIIYFLLLRIFSRGISLYQYLYHYWSSTNYRSNVYETYYYYYFIQFSLRCLLQLSISCVYLRNTSIEQYHV